MGGNTNGGTSGCTNAGTKCAMLYNFLTTFKVEKGSEFTHTSFLRPGGAFYIPASRTQEFYASYKAALRAGEDLYVTEKHRHIGPVVADFDFRYADGGSGGDGSSGSSGSPPKRRHTEKHVVDIVRALCDSVAHYVTCPSEGLRVYVLEKSGPVAPKPAPQQQHAETGTTTGSGGGGGGLVKDGLHIVIPGVVTRPAVQYLIRDALLAHPGFKACVEDLGPVNRPDDIVDRAVIETNNWTMYGSKKPGSEPYLVTRAYSYTPTSISNIYTGITHATVSSSPSGAKERGEEEHEGRESCCKVAADSEKPGSGGSSDNSGVRYDTEKAKAMSGSMSLRGAVGSPWRGILRAISLARDQAEYVEELSIRNKYRETSVRNEMVSVVAELQGQMDDKARKRQAVQRVMAGPTKERANTSPDCVDTARKLVRLLSPHRMENYGDWIRLGWCLRNIDHRLLDAWVEFSKQSSKYIEGECETLWAHMRQGGLNIGTLHMWAKQDNPVEYRELIRSDLFDLIHKSINGTHYDVARVVHHMYRYEFVCSSLRNRTWWEFRDHRWRNCDSAVSLRKRVSNEVVQEYNNMCAYHSHRSMQTDNDNEQLTHTRMNVELGKVALQLKRSNFKDNVIKECCELFFREKFEELLDSNRDLLGFENGVYDLDNMEFREGRPDDFVSFSTGIHYVPYDKDDECVHDIHNFFRQVLPNDAVRTYVLTLLASFLSGHTREERFHIWTGSGSNGKSKVIDLFEGAFGDYCCKLPVTLLTGKRAASNAATGEVARAKGKRFACLQEPSENERLNIGLMKELTGGDKIMARMLFSNPIEFRPMFKMVLLCNHLPHVPSDDGGTWRRIRLVEFKSKFVAEPTKENEFPMDVEIPQKFETWAPHFMSILLEYYKSFCRTGTIQEPDEVLACTREYQKDNDHYADFVDTCLERSPDANHVELLTDVFQEFKDWVNSDNIPMRVPKKNDVKNYLDKHIGKHVLVNGIPGYRGFKIRNRYSVPSQEEGEDDLLG